MKQPTQPRVPLCNELTLIPLPFKALSFEWFIVPPPSFCEIYFFLPTADFTKASLSITAVHLVICEDTQSQKLSQLL